MPPANSLTAVITGGTSGIGLATAKLLAPHLSALTLLGRSQKRGQKAVRSISKTAPGCRIEFRHIDLSALHSVRRTAEDLRSLQPKVDILINSADARIDTFQLSPDGYELTFATNHLGPFLFTLLLKDSLTRSPAPRVITVSSSAHRAAGPDSPSLFQRETYDRRQAYAKYKLANILFAFELSRRWAKDRITSNVIEPGNVATRFARNNGLLPWLKHRVAQTFDRTHVSATGAARPIADLAVNPKYQGLTGKYFIKGTQAQPSDLAKDPCLARELWELSLRLSGMSECEFACESTHTGQACPAAGS